MHLSIYLSTCLPIYLFISLSVYLSTYLPIDLSIYLISSTLIQSNPIWPKTSLFFRNRLSCFVYCFYLIDSIRLIYLVCLIYRVYLSIHLPIYLSYHLIYLMYLSISSTSSAQTEWGQCETKRRISNLIYLLPFQFSIYLFYLYLSLPVSISISISISVAISACLYL